MRAIYKKTNSLLLVVSMLFGTFSALAFENKDIKITLSEEIPSEHEIELPDKLPEIKIDENKIKSKSSDVSMYNISTIEPEQPYTGQPQIEMPDDSPLEVPINRNTSDESQVNENEIGNEDIAKIEELKIKRLEEFNKHRKQQEEPNLVNNSARVANSLPIDSSHRLANINNKDSYALQNQTGKTNYIGDNIGK